MATFFSNLFDRIQSVFKSKKLDDNITDFQRRMDLIITDLILPYAQPNQQPTAGKDRYRDLITLLDAKQCNKIAITMSNNLDKNYTKLQLEQFASNILIGREQTTCNDETCSSNGVPSIDNKNKKVSKKEICNAIAVHYVKILNLISAILTAVNPMDNICLNRLRNLLTIISEDEQKGISGICDPAANVVKQSIMHEPGFKELLILYYYHLMQDTETEEEKTNVRNQYQILVKTLSSLLMFVEPSLKESPEMNSMVARELSERNEALGGNENENTELKEKNNENLENLENLDKEPNVVSPPEVSANNIANIRKNISNFKANENAKLNSIITKIEGLNQIIADIQTKTKEQPAPTSAMEPALSTMEPTPTSAMEPAPSTMEPTLTSAMEPAPSTMEPISSEIKTDLPESETDSETESEYEDEDDDEDDDDDLLEEELKENTTSMPATPNTTGVNTAIPSATGANTIIPSTTSANSAITSATGANTIIPSTTSANTSLSSTSATTATAAPAANQTKSNNNKTKEINDLLNQISEEAPAPAQTGGADNNNLNRQTNNILNNKNNQGNNEENNEVNNLLAGSNANAPAINTQELKTNNTLLDKFLEFVDFYAKIDKIDDKIIEIVNTAFKTYDKFSNETQLEANLRITEDDFDNFCINNINDNAQIPITLNDPRLTEYLKIYKDLKSVYLDNCEYLLTLLEKQVLVKEEGKAGESTTHFTLREINYADLASLETDVRNRLVNMYSQCQQNYQAGIKALFNALKEPQA